MKKFKKLVGLLLCLAMVLSILPASVIGTVKAATTTSDILEKIDLSGTVVGTCSSPYSSSVSYKNQNWYSTQNPGWKTLDKFVNGSTSDEITYSISSGERGDVYLDLTKKDSAGISADQFKMYYGAGSSSASMPTVTVILELANGSTKEKTFTTNWSGTTAGTPITWDFGETLTIKGIYAYSPSSSKFSVSEIELYHYIEIPYLETATLNGVDLSQYKIVYSASDLDYAKTAAEYIQKEILMRTGRQVDVVTDSTSESTYEIQVGNVNRTYAKSISAPSETAMKFTFASNGTKIAMKADYFIIAGAAYYFVDTYIGTESFSNTANTGVTTQNTITKKAKNYIMLIGDGMGVMQTRLYEKYGAAPTTGTYGFSDGEDIFYGYYLPYLGYSKTANIYGEITDSAAGGTALSTGYKTINGYVGKDQYLNDVKNLSELAMEMGKSVAVMSTEGADGATPADFSAHSDGRYNDDEILADQENFEGLLVDGYNNYKEYTASEFATWDSLFKAGLNSVAADPDGFFIMYEEAHIDKVCHQLNFTSSAGYTGTQDMEVLFRTVYRFNQAIGTFMEYALYNPDTAVLITADHETSGLNSSFKPTEGNPVDEQKYGSVWNHSLQDVPVFTYGVGMDIFDGETVENASIGRTFAHVMTDGNASDFGDPTYPIIGGESGGSTNTVQTLPTSKITNPQFGYYANGNTNGAITPYYQSGREPAYLIDGGATNQARSQYYLYSDIANKTKVPAIQLDLTEATVLTGIKINGYEYGRYNMEDFEIQVYTEDGEWVTVASWNDAFVDGTNGDDVNPLAISFQQPVTATKVRILISQITDMSAEAYDDAESIELLEGSYIRVKEVTLYYDTAATPGETPEPGEPTTNPTQAPTQTPTLPEGGELEQGQIYKIINNATYLTGWAGYVNASGSLVEVSGEGECLVEGAYGRCAYLNENISGETAAVAEITMSKTFNVGAIEITGDRNTQLDPTNFEIQAYINGVWTTVKSVTNAFTGSPRTERYTFGPVETNKIRLYITSHEGSYCSIGEIELFEVTTGNIANKIDLSDANVTADSGVTAAGSLTSAVVGSVTDGDKSTIVTFNSNYPTIAIDLTKADGTPTNVSAFSLFGNRSGNRPTSVEIQIQTTNGGSYTSIGTYSFSANNVTSYPFQPYYTELGASYDAYGLKVIVKSLNYAETAGCALAEIELYGGEEGSTPDEPTTPTEPTDPTETPTEAPVTGEKQKVDLTGTVIGACSTNSATAGSYDDFTWWSDGRPTWKPLENFVDGNLSTYFSFGASPGERADLYLDLSKGGTGSTAVGEFTIYHSSQGDVPSIQVVLILADGTEWTKTYATNWAQFAGSLNFTETFTENKNAVGMYIWQNGSDSAHFGDIEIYQYVGGSTTEPTTPPATQPTTPPATEPTPPATAPVGPMVPATGTYLELIPESSLTPYVGDYENGNFDTLVNQDPGEAAYLTNGRTSGAGWIGSASTSGTQAAVIELNGTKMIGGVELVARTSDYLKTFEIQVKKTDGTWVTVQNVTSDPFNGGRSVMYTWTPVEGTAIRVLCYSWSSSRPMLQEISIFEAKTGNILQEVVPSGVSCPSAVFTPGANVDNTIDGTRGDYVNDYFMTNGLPAVLTFDMTKDGAASNVKRMIIYGFHTTKYAPANIKVEVQTEADGAFTQIYNGTAYEANFVDTFVLDFDKAYDAYAIRLTVNSILAEQLILTEVDFYGYQMVAEPEEPDTILVGASYSVHLIEPWALRTNVQFAKNTVDNLIPVSNFTDYGAYAIIGSKFDGTTAEDLMADPDAVKYTKADGNITAEGTTLTFDFYDGLYSYNLGETVYWVAYYVDDAGTYTTSVQAKSLTEVADGLLADQDVSASEKAVLESMKEMKDTVIALRGENADLGNVYAPGVANTGLGDRNTGYQFGASHQMKLIEPWGVRVRVLMRDKTAAGGVYADYANADDYGVIFFHDKDGKYGGTMTTAQMSAETDAKVYSKLSGNAQIVANGVTAVYDHEIYTYDLDTELYCLPYIVVDGEYYYPSAVICWNLLDEMVEFSQNENLSDEEIAVFEAILKMYENVQNHLN